VATVLAHTNGSALSMWYTVSAIVGGGLAGLFLLAFLTQRASRNSCYIAIGLSLLFTAYATLTIDGGKLWNVAPYNFPYHNYMIGVFGHLIVFGGGYLLSFIFPNRNVASRELTLWGWLLKRDAVNEHNLAQEALLNK